MTNFVSRFTWHDTFPNNYLAVVGNQWFVEIGIYLESTWKRGGPPLKSLVYSRKGNVLRSLKEECHADDVKQKRDRPYEPSQPTNGTFVPSMKPADCCVASPLKASKFQAWTNTRVTILKRACFDGTWETARCFSADGIAERFSYQSHTSFTDAINITCL